MNRDENRVILVIDPDRERRKQTTKVLKREDFIIIESSNIKEGETLCIQYSPDLLFLTSLYNLIDDFDFCSRFKRFSSESKILSSTIVKKGFFNYQEPYGVIDDYISFPFSEDELIWRMKKLLSISSPEAPLCYRGLKFFKNRKELVLNDILIYLSPKESCIIETIIKGNGICRSKELEHCINSSQAATRMCINRLRKKLEANTGMKIIKTRYGEGYYIAI